MPANGINPFNFSRFKPWFEPVANPVPVMEIHHSISQNTLSFLVEKALDFKVDRTVKKSPYLFLNIGFISSDASSQLGL